VGLSSLQWEDCMAAVTLGVADISKGKDGLNIAFHYKLGLGSLLLLLVLDLVHLPLEHLVLRFPLTNPLLP
jgi:hypothetical protein